MNRVSFADPVDPWLEERFNALLEEGAKRYDILKDLKFTHSGISIYLTHVGKGWRVAVPYSKVSKRYAMEINLRAKNQENELKELFEIPITLEITAPKAPEPSREELIEQQIEAIEDKIRAYRQGHPESATLPEMEIASIIGEGAEYGRLVKELDELLGKL